MYNRLVKNKRLILSLPLLLAASLFVPSHVVPPTHAQFTGLVCITASTTATSCPASPPSLGPFTVGQTFTVGVFIQGSDAMGAFDIYVASNPAFVTPVSAALGSLIVSPSLTSICVNGSTVIGSCTTGPGVVEVSTIESSGSNECGGLSPCSGMAFTITYHVVGATPTTSLSYPTAASCSTNSVSSPPNTCVVIADNLGTTLPENIQGATVTISAPLGGMVCITSLPTATSCPIGAPDIQTDSAGVPLKVGSTFTVGVFVQNSAPMGGFDIYVSANLSYLKPISAALGNLIAHPSSTSICINGFSMLGGDPPTCGGDGTADPGGNGPGDVNGPGVAYVETLDGTGLNECGNISPCSGMAFTITYTVVGTAPSTNLFFPISPPGVPMGASACMVSSVSSPANVCCLVADAQGTTIALDCQGATITQNINVVQTTKFFTDTSLNPLPLDRNGNPMVNVVLARGIVESTNPGRVLAWVNVTNAGSVSLQSLKLNETLPIDWTVDPPWMPAKGAIHVFYANTTSLSTNPEITDASTITVSAGNPQTVTLAIPSLNVTAIGHPLMPGQSVLLSVKLTYSLIKTSQSFASYPRNYTDTASAAAWTLPSYTGTEAATTSSGFFTAYAKVVGDPGGDAPIIDVSKYAIV